MTVKELKDAIRTAKHYLEGERINPETGRRFHDPPVSDWELDRMLESVGIIEFFNAFPDRVEPGLKAKDKIWLLKQVAEVKKMHARRMKQIPAKPNE